MSRGRLKVWLGAAPGVGKTYALLEEGHRLSTAGHDVVIGYVDPHHRPETAALIGNLEQVPRLTLHHKGAAIEEMDLKAVLRRRPEMVLVDELAHTNAPGSGHAKRWQDVQDLLEAGIDVLSTVDIQHLESLNDVIYEITGVAEKETIPDEIVRRADEIELVDLTQEGVRERLAAGKIYPAEQIDANLANYFRAGNLGALRELALSWTADRVDEAVAKYRALHGIDQPWETKERVIVAVAGIEGGEAVIRRAARLAMRSRAELVGLHVRPSNIRASEEASRLLSDQVGLLQQLGGRFHEVVGENVGASLLAFAREENATQIVLGASRRSRFDQWVQGSPVSNVIRNARDVDVHVISYQSGRRSRGLPTLSGGASIGNTRTVLAWAIPLVGLPGLTWALFSYGEGLALHNVLLIYLLAAVLAGSLGGALPAVVTAAAGFLLANWFFTPPSMTWTIANPDDLFSLIAFLVVSLVVGLLVGYSSRRTAEARRARAQAEALAGAITLQRQVVASTTQGLLMRVRDLLSLEAVALIRRTESGWDVLAWEGARRIASPDEGSETIGLTDDFSLVILDGRLTAEDRTVLKAFAAQIVHTIERAELEKEAESAETMAETDRLRNALLRAVSHDLRTPLATIKASLTSLLETGVEWPPEQVETFLGTALDETERLDRLVGQLLDASRVQAGAVHVFFRPVGVDEVVSAALGGLRPAPGRVIIDVSEALPEVQTDPDLLERVIANLAENALNWSPPDKPVRIGAGAVAGRVDLRVVDQGPGIPTAQRQQVFQPFQRLGDSPNRDGVGLGLAVASGLLEAMGNELVIEDTPGGGTTMVITLKVAGPIETPTVDRMSAARG